MLRLIAPATSLKTTPSNFSSSSASMNQPSAQHCRPISAPRKGTKAKDLASPRPPAQTSDESHEFSVQARSLCRLIEWQPYPAWKQRGRSSLGAVLGQAVKATGPNTARHRRFSQVSISALQGGSLLRYQQAVPNPSLKRSANGVPPGPQGRAVYHRPRGPAVTPLSPA